MIARVLSVAALVLLCATAFADTSAPSSTKGMKATVLPDGLEFVDQKVGTGAEAKAGKKVKVHYTGWLADSKKKFDSSVDRHEPIEFTLGTGMVIKGWDEGIAGHEGRRPPPAAHPGQARLRRARRRRLHPAERRPHLRLRARRRRIAAPVTGELISVEEAQAARARPGAPARRRAGRRSSPRSAACSPKTSSRPATCRRTTTRRWTATPCAPPTPSTARRCASSARSPPARSPRARSSPARPIAS